LSPTVQGDDQVLFNQVFIDAQVEREVDNDQLSVTMVVEHEGNQPDDIARKVNKDMQWALNLANTCKGVEVGTGSYQTYPVYKVRIIVGWRATQELQLRSINISELTELVGELQRKLQVRQMSFSPTKETRVKIENDLINEAMEAFKDRVNIIKTHMDNKDYRIVDLRINTGQAQPIIYQERMMSMTTTRIADAPAVEAGTSKVVITVSGSVQFF